MIQNSLKWELKYFDLSDKELDELIEKNSENNFVYIEFSYKDLGKSEEWFKEQVRGLNNDRAIIKREILLEWPYSNELSVFSEEQLENLKAALKPVKFTTNIDGYIIKWYQQIDLLKNYLIGVDVSGGLSKDNSTIVFVEPSDFSVAAVFKNNKIDTDSLKKLIEKIMGEYFTNAILICEKNSFGLNILQSLMKNAAIEPRILQEEKTALAEKTTKDGFMVRRKTKSFSYGVDTTEKSRKLMFELLPVIVDEEFDKINSEDIYNDIAGLERKKNNKVEHSANTHDDTLMAYLIVRYALAYGNYLKNRGISSIPSVSNIKKQGSYQDITKIESIIRNANLAEEMAGSDNISDNFKIMLNRDQQLKRINGESSSGLDMFMNLFD